VFRKETLYVSEEPGRLELTDPRAMRALAHPVRLALLELLAGRPDATATECSNVVDESPQSCSYHLRQLAKWGFVRQVQGPDARETRWQAAFRGIQFRLAASPSLEFQAAASLLQARMIERDDRHLAEFLGLRHALPAEWEDAAEFTSGVVRVTPAELAELAGRLRELLKPLVRLDPEERPEGAKPVHVVFRAFPRVDSQSEET
jgi:predicted transcriptional regulator